MKRYIKYSMIVVAIVVLDHATKLLAHFYIGFSGKTISIIGSLLEIHYVLNEGMAFGIKFGFKYGKLLLTFIRILLSTMIISHIKKLIDHNKSVYSITAWCFIIGGAIGNTIDGIFYGVLLDNASAAVPTKWFYGQVIDMIAVDVSYFYKIVNFIPFLKDLNIVNSYPVFNVADTFITVGVLILVTLDFYMSGSKKSVSN